MESTMERYMGKVATLGKAALSVLYPNDFESYVISLELTTWDNESIAYFTFPINPVSLDYEEQALVSVKKTFGGVSTMFDKGLNPDDIHISGNFGKKFRFILNDKVESFNSVLGVSKTSFSEGVDYPEFSKFIKTGYGSIKVLQKLIYDSYAQDHGKPRLLYLHNNAFGQSFLIRVKSRKFSIQESRNLWEYSLNIEILAPSDLIVRNPEKDDRSLQKAFARGSIQNIVNSAAKQLQKKLI